MKKTYVVISIILSAHALAQADDQLWEQSRYFDTAFLSDYDGVKAALRSDGFKEITIPTNDGLNLQGLLLERPNAQCTVISCCGFYPGRKEGMASLYALLPISCNILFLDARGHGKSEGKFLSNLHHYGQHEYRDILAALNIARSLNKPIIIHAICAGAFHATRALLNLQENNALASYRVRGLIFDSGFSSILHALSIPQKHARDKIIPRLFTGIYRGDTKKKIQERMLYKITWAMCAPCIRGIEWCLKPWLASQESETNIFDKMHALTCPIFFIHAVNDSYVSFDSIVALSAQAHHKQCWWIQDSEHACNHLKHAEEYREKLHEFIDTSMMQSSS